MLPDFFLTRDEVGISSLSSVARVTNDDSCSTSCIFCTSMFTSFPNKSSLTLNKNVKSRTYALIYVKTKLKVSF